MLPIHYMKEYQVFCILYTYSKMTFAKVAILNVQMLGFRMVRPFETRTFEIRTIKRSVFELIRYLSVQYSNVQYSSPHCILIQQTSKCSSLKLNCATIITTCYFIFTGTKVIVTNLQPSVSQEDIAELFGDVGPLKRAKGELPHASLSCDSKVDTV